MNENKYPERKALRLPNYDYSQNGCYFITFCVKDGKPLLGTINTVAIHRVGTGLCARPCSYGAAFSSPEKSKEDSKEPSLLLSIANRTIFR